MRPYFEKMDALGKALKRVEIDEMAENREQLAAIVAELDAEVNRVKTAGLPAAKIRERDAATARLTPSHPSGESSPTGVSHPARQDFLRL